MKDKKPTRFKNIVLPAFAGIMVFAFTLFLATGLATAAPLEQDDMPPAGETGKNCAECHLDIAEDWSHSPHAHAYDDPHFQERWDALGSPGECLACHTTSYIASTGEYYEEGVGCVACHGETSSNHPPEIVPVYADAEYCGECHTTTLGEWKMTMHAPTGVGCMQCHNPHNQQPLFENKDDLCINCHQEDMDRYLEDLHIQKGIGCVDCHALVIPPEVPPDDGIVPTGHAFNITPATCVACHTDALHAGFSLPGYENGTTGMHAITSTITGTAMTPTLLAEAHANMALEDGETLTPEQKVQALEAALANRNITLLFQGGVVGLVLGSSTAWIVARNVRRIPGEEPESTDDEKEGINGSAEEA